MAAHSNKSSVVASMKKIGNLNEERVSEFYLNMGGFVKLLWKNSLQLLLMSVRFICGTRHDVLLLSESASRVYFMCNRIRTKE